MAWVVRQYLPYNWERWIATSTQYAYTDQRAAVFIEDIKASQFITKSSLLMHTPYGEFVSDLVFSPKQFPDIEFTIQATTPYENWGTGASERTKNTPNDASNWLSDVWQIDTTGMSGWDNRNHNQTGIMYPTSIKCKGSTFKSIHHFNDEAVYAGVWAGQYGYKALTTPSDVRPTNFNMASKCWGISNEYLSYASGVCWDNRVFNFWAVYHGFNDETGEFFFAGFDTEENRLGLLNYFAPIHSSPHYTGANPFRYGVLTASIGRKNGIEYPICTMEGFREDGTSMQLGFTTNNYTHYNLDTTFQPNLSLDTELNRANLPFSPNFSPIYPLFKDGNGSPFIVGKFGSLQVSPPSNQVYSTYDLWGHSPVFESMGIIASKWLNFPDIGVAMRPFETSPLWARIWGFPQTNFPLTEPIQPVGGFIEGRFSGKPSTNENLDNPFGYVSPSVGTPINSPDPLNPDGTVNPEGTNYSALYVEFTALVNQALDSLYIDVLNGVVNIPLMFMSNDPETVKRLTYEYYKPRMMAHFIDWANSTPRSTDLAVIKSYALD